MFSRLGTTETLMPAKLLPGPGPTPGKGKVIVVATATASCVAVFKARRAPLAQRRLPVAEPGVPPVEGLGPSRAAAKRDTPATSYCD